MTSENKKFFKDAGWATLGTVGVIVAAFVVVAMFLILGYIFT